MSTTRGLIESGAVSGNETQFVFSDDDVRTSDADNVHRPALGKFCYSEFHYAFLKYTLNS